MFTPTYTFYFIILNSYSEIFHLYGLMMVTSIWIGNFIAIWQGIVHGVMEETVVAITPWEWFGADTQMFVGNELWAWMFAVLNMAQPSIQHA